MPQVYKDRILKFLKREEYEPLKLAQLAKALGVGEADSPAFQTAFEELRRAGHVVVGAPADLLLVDGDPLANLRVLRTPVGVMANGRWLARAQLDSMLAGARQR